MTTKTTTAGWAPATPAPVRWTRTKKVLKGIFFVWLTLTAIKFVFLAAVMLTS